MTKTGFITVEVPVHFEKGPDGWYSWIKVDLCGPDAATPERAIKDLKEKIEELSKDLRKIAVKQGKLGP